MTTNTNYAQVSDLSRLCSNRDPTQILRWELEGAIPKIKTGQDEDADEEHSKNQVIPVTGMKLNCLSHF